MEWFPLSSPTIINVTYNPLNLSEELTVVTAFFNIGEFAKGRTDVVFTPNLYKEWLKAGIILLSEDYHC